MKTLNLLILVGMMLGVTSFSMANNVNTEKSTLKWNGKKVSGEHYGFVKLKSGFIDMSGNQIKEGRFEIDMTTITNVDLKDDTWNKKLVDHLKSDDFFSVVDHPVAILDIKEATSFKQGKSLIKADLTIKGITHPVEFEAERENNIYNAKIIIDRTKYNVRYGSGKFFDNLGDNLIYDDFSLEVKVLVD